MVDRLFLLRAHVNKSDVVKQRTIIINFTMINNYYYIIIITIMIKNDFVFQKINHSTIAITRVINYIQFLGKAEHIQSLLQLQIFYILLCLCTMYMQFIVVTL